MKTTSNNEIAQVQRWKEGQYFVSINHKDNGIQIEEEEGNRYEADFTIVDALTAEEAIYAFTRMTNDVEFDNKVIDNIEVNGKPAIETKQEYLIKVETTIFKELPTSGNLKIGEIYSYNNGAVMVVQDHIRTIYAPELTPNLFSFYRTIKEGQEWITGEKVEIDETRTYNEKTYKCIQAHQTQPSWNPELTLGTLWNEVQEQGEQPPQWVSGNWNQYIMGYQVFDGGKVWEVIGLTHTWIQPALDGDGAISWIFVKNWD